MAPCRSGGGPTLIRIESIAAGGDGIGRLDDGRAVFVPRTAPGDLVELGQVRTQARFARGRIARLVEPGPGRVEPACPHYTADACGSCQLQHLSAPAQLEAKRQIVEDTLRRIGRLEVVVPPVIAAQNAWGYRSRISLAVGPGRRFAGYHTLGDAGRVFGLTHCAIAAPELMQLWPALRRHLQLLPTDATHIMLRLDRGGARHVVVKAAGHQAWSNGPRLGAALATAGVPATIWWHPEAGAARVVDHSGELFPATVFEQVHPALGDTIRTAAIAALGPLTGAQVWDLYAGIGETSALLLEAGARVESVELDRRAVEFAERRVAAAVPANAGDSPSMVRRVGRVEDLVQSLGRPNAVIANPPRAGLSPPVLAALLAHRPTRIAYISCDPATLARDLGRLCAGASAFRLRTVQPYDLFPQTAHVEILAVLEA
ncbi:MAG: TRAM domain-containing protein [Gemmatimonadales bacterium]